MGSATRWPAPALVTTASVAGSTSSTAGSGRSKQRARRRAPTGSARITAGKSWPSTTLPPSFTAVHRGSAAVQRQRHLRLQHWDLRLLHGAVHRAPTAAAGLRNDGLSARPAHRPALRCSGRLQLRNWRVYLHPTRRLRLVLLRDGLFERLLGPRRVRARHRRLLL